MPRKLRLEFPGALYHVINRGNYRADIFATPGARAAFLKCLWEACHKSGWRLHAFVLMRNHFHLALETPQGNLVNGMQWLQATFANRFNRRRGERGHLFQGRYKALLVEPGTALGQVCHYLHLNPVRARILPVSRLRQYPDSSYAYLWQKAERPACLHVQTALTQAGGLADTPRGWQAYQRYLVWQSAHGPSGRSKAFVSMSRGWALGSQSFKESLIQDHALAAESRAWESGGKEEVRRAHWERELAAARKTLGRQPPELTCGPPSQPWKIALMTLLKERTQASNTWLAEKFATRPKYISKLVCTARRQPQPSPEFATLRGKGET